MSEHPGQPQQPDESAASEGGVPEAPTGSSVPLLPRRNERALLLLALDWTRHKDPRVPLGHASLVAALREVSVLQVTPLAYSINAPDFDLEQVLREIRSWDRAHASTPRDLALGVYIWNERYTQQLLVALRHDGFGGRILLGGPQISYAPAGIARFYPGADGFIRGYGETALSDVATNSEPVHRPGVTWQGQEDSASRAEADLASLPSPLLTGVVPVIGQRYLRWETQRGCPFRCTFCQHREPGARLQNAQLPFERLRKEISLFAEMGTQEIDVLDPIFNVGPTHLQVLEEMVRQRIQARLSLQCRLEFVKPEFLELCARLNTRLEFGLQTIHKLEGQIIHRQNNLDVVKRTLNELSHRGLRYVVTLIYGLPGQTLQSFRETVDFCLKHRVPIIRAFPLNLLRGTELEQDRARWGLVENDDAIPVVIRSSTFDESDWCEMRRIAAALTKTEGTHPASLMHLLKEPYLNVA